MNDKEKYDVVIVGAGIAGAIVAKSLSQRGKRVLILEGGTSILKLDSNSDLKQIRANSRNAWIDYHENFLATFYNAGAKIPNSPYPFNPNSPQPNVLKDIPSPGDGFDWKSQGWENTEKEKAWIETQKKGQPEKPYFVQKGPLPFSSTYTRTTGGTTLHWMGTCLRMLPNDFKVRTNYLSHNPEFDGLGLDWPISYKDLMPYYRRAEREIGVAGDVESQKIHGITFDSGYVFPMDKIPQSHLDQKIEQSLKTAKPVKFTDGEEFELAVQSTPQGRNGMPNPKYQDYVDPELDATETGKAFRPVGAVGNPVLGERCDGNSNCVPICPIQAKYNALKTLNSVDKSRVDLREQAVAFEILFNKEDGHIEGIKYKRYSDKNSTNHEVKTAVGTKYVLAASAIENARLMLASDCPNPMIGRNLLDHPSMVTWGLMPEKIGSYRGPGSTSGIPAFRDGAFRSQHAAFRIEIGNWGWSWPHLDPFMSLGELVTDKPGFMTPPGTKSLIDEAKRQGLTPPLYGTELREFVKNTMGRQFRIAFEFEQLANPENKVTIDRKKYVDKLGNPLPVLHYNLSDYDKAAMAAAKGVSDHMFKSLHVTDFTHAVPSQPGYVEYEGNGYVFAGAGHVGGTHIMGTKKGNSVVDKRQRCWDHDNLYLVGSGNFPSLATSNPTLTIAALAFWSADNINEDLGA